MGSSGNQGLTKADGEHPDVTSELCLSSAAADVAAQVGVMLDEIVVQSTRACASWPPGLWSRDFEA